MWKAPFRTNEKISQSFDDGIIKIYRVTNAAPSGYAPRERLDLKVTLRYSEQRLGINRLYQARQNQTEIERVVRVLQSTVEITNRDMAETENGVQYGIESVQSVPDSYPKALDIALVRIEQGGSNG